MPNSPITDDSNLVTFEIKANGSAIPETYGVLDIRIEQHVNRISEAEITLRDGEAADNTFPITDADTFKPGSEVEILLGYETTNVSIFTGIVVKQIVRIDDHSGSRLQVVCKDKCLKMTVNRKNGIFTEITDSDLISQLVSNSGLQADVTSTSVQHKEIVQYYSTDWDFIMNRAELNGLVVTTNAGKLTAAVPDVSATPELSVTFGYDIHEFEGELDATHQFSAVQGNTWDMASQSIVNASSSEPTVNQQGNLTGSTLADVLGAGDGLINSSVVLDQDHVQAWVDAALLKSRLSQYRGSITFQGSSKAKPNTTIELNGLGDRFNGNAFISGVVHTLREGAWNTEARIGLSPEWFVEKHPVVAPGASGIVPGIRGLQTGIVQKIDSDPDNEFRVQVEIPILGADGEYVWARLASFYTGSGFGAYFMPEISDEVILGFMNDDPRFPVILGSVFSSSISPSETPEENNNIKTLLTRTGMQVKFDEENKVITILTPGGNTMVLSDQDKGITITDQNSNQIQMNDSGITVDSKSSLTLQATNDVTIKGATISVNGDQSYSCSSMQVSISGDTSTDISGGASCGVSSDGEMSVKGSIVMVN
ncbi:MAG: type VI secretion system tip protein VgrG [Bacteroidota bacterium]